MSLTTLHKVRHLAMDGQWKQIEAFFNQSPQLLQIGASIDLGNPQKPVVCIREISDMHRGGVGGDAVNGGVISMMVDLAIGILGLPFLSEGMTATSHLSIHFVKPLMATGIHLEAEISKVIGNRIFGTATVMNEKGEVCAFASGTLVKGISV